MKKYREYFAVSLIVSGILGLIMILKGIYPFGHNSLIYSDGALQQTSFMYYLYDIIKNGQNIFIDFNIAGGMNFLGNFFYYLFSPINFIIVLFSRTDIYKVMSIVIIIKALLSAITSLYMLNKIFPKLNSLEKISLSILYAFSGYFLNYYIITSWMDTLWILPLIITGIYNIVKNNNYKMYFVTLLLSIIMCFYTSALLLILILILYFIYIKFFSKESLHQKLSILSITTVLALICSAFVLIPTVLSIQASARVGFSLTSIVDSPVGMILDKITLFLPMGILLSLFLALFIFLKKKNDKRGLKFLFIMSPLIFIPIVFEPINKILHLGSYFMFPVRYGFIYSIIFVLTGAYFLNNYRGNSENKLTKISAIIGSVIMFGIAYKYKYLFNDVLNSLTIYTDKKVFLILLIMFIIGSFITLFILNLKKRAPYLLGVAIILSLSFSYCYLGIDNAQKFYNTHYQDYYKVNDVLKDNNQKLKNTDIDDEFNYGDVIGTKSDYSFSSLNSNQAVKALEILGYTRKANMITTSGGTLFTDILLGNKYALSFKDYHTGYDLVNVKLENYYLHQLSNEYSFGFVMKDIYFHNLKGFELQNALYSSITDTDDKLFDIADITNLEFSYNSDNSKLLYLYITPNIEDTSYNPYKDYDIYINNQLYLYNKNKRYNVPGILELGNYDGIVNIKLVPKKENLNNIIKFAILDTKDLEILGTYKDQIKYDGSKFTVTSLTSGQYLFIPLNAIDGTKIINNGKEVQFEKVLNNYFAVKLNKGINEIKIDYETPGLKIGLIISLIGLIISLIILFKDNLLKIIKIFDKFPFISYIYHIIVVLVILVIYVLPLIGFMLYLF